ncbi:MAG: hypothetical protein WA160_06275 [Pseudobdellovibrio sp.]
MKFLKIILCILLLPLSTFSQLQNQLNLDDIEIKGEAQGSKGLGVSARKKNDLSSRIQLKSDFTSDIIEELPEGFKLPAEKVVTSK